MFFADVTGVTKIFADVTACAFDNVTTMTTQIFFDDVTANLKMFQIVILAKLSFMNFA